MDILKSFLIASEGAFRRRLISGFYILILTTFHIIYFGLLPNYREFFIALEPFLIFIAVLFYIVGAVVDIASRFMLPNIPPIIRALFHVLTSPALYIYVCKKKRKLVSSSAFNRLLNRRLDPFRGTYLETKSLIERRLSHSGREFWRKLDEQSLRDLVMRSDMPLNPTTQRLAEKLTDESKAALFKFERNFLELFAIFQITAVYGMILISFLSKCEPTGVECLFNSPMVDKYARITTAIAIFVLYMDMFRKSFGGHYRRKIVFIIEGQTSM